MLSTRPARSASRCRRRSLGVESTSASCARREARAGRWWPWVDSNGVTLFVQLYDQGTYYSGNSTNCCCINTWYLVPGRIYMQYFSLHPGMFIFFVSLRLCSNLLLSASTYFIVPVLSACVMCTLYPISGILLFFYSSSFFFGSSYFSGGVVFCCALVPGKLALDLPTLIL